MSATDWSAYQKCDVCGAALAKPCISFAGYVAGAQGGVVEVEADEPHSTRPLRTEAARTGGQR